MPNKLEWSAYERLSPAAWAARHALCPYSFCDTTRFRSVIAPFIPTPSTPFEQPPSLFYRVYHACRLVLRTHVSSMRAPLDTICVCILSYLCYVTLFSLLFVIPSTRCIYINRKDRVWNNICILDYYNKIWTLLRNAFRGIILILFLGRTLVVLLHSKICLSKLQRWRDDSVMWRSWQVKKTKSKFRRNKIVIIVREIFGNGELYSILYNSIASRW